MKKSLVRITVLACMLTVNFSCVKTYTCSCHTPHGTTEEVPLRSTKSQASSDCKAKAVGSYTACTLK